MSWATPGFGMLSTQAQFDINFSPSPLLKHYQIEFKLQVVYDEILPRVMRYATNISISGGTIQGNVVGYLSGKNSEVSYIHNDLAMELMMGDKFDNIQSSTIVNRSMVEKSFNKVKSDFDEETAVALKKVADEIEKSHNKEAAENFDSFNEELQKSEPRRAVLRSLWSGVTTALPTITQMTDATTKIAKLLGY